MAIEKEQVVIEVKGQIDPSVQQVITTLRQIADQNKITAEQFKKSTEGLGESTRALKPAVDGGAQAMQGWRDSLRQTEATLTTLPAKLAEVRQRVDEMKRAGQTSGVQWQLYNVELNRLTDQNRKLDAALKGTGKGFGDLRFQMQNASYQFTDFLVSVNSGTSATRALGQQLPQLLGGFGAIGAVLGLVSVIALPALSAAIEKLFPSMTSFKEHSDQLDSSLKDMTAAADNVDFTPLIKQFNDADVQTRRNIVSGLEYKLVLLQLTAEERRAAAAAELSSKTSVSFWDRLKSIKATGLGFEGDFDILASKLNVSVRQVRELLDLTQQFGAEIPVDKATELAKGLSGGNPAARELGRLLLDIAIANERFGKASEEARKAQDAMNEALKTGGKVALPGADKESREGLSEYQKLLRSLTEELEKVKASGIDRELSKADAITASLAAGTLKLSDAEKERVLSLATLIDEQKRSNDLTREAWSYVENADESAAKARTDEIVAQTKAMNDFAETVKNAVNPLYEWEAVQRRLDEAWISGRISMEELIKYTEVMGAKGAKSIEPMDKAMKNLAAQGIGGLVDAIFSADKSFKQFAGNFLLQIAKMIIQQQIFNALKGTALGGLLGFAKGGAFSSSTGLPFGVYNKPTFFNMPGNGPLQKFARGGVLGEAGPEAIIPLRRGGDGKLGVSSAPVNVNVINNAGAQVSVEKDGDNINVIVDRVRNALTRDIRSGGNVFAGALQGTYGLNRAHS